MEVWAIHKGRLQALSLEELNRLCRELSSDWIRAGSPDEDMMPRWMLARYIVLKAERERRGEQLRLC